MYDILDTLDRMSREVKNCIVHLQSRLLSEAGERLCQITNEIDRLGYSSTPSTCRMDVLPLQPRSAADLTLMTSSTINDAFSSIFTSMKDTWHNIIRLPLELLANASHFFHQLGTSIANLCRTILHAIVFAAMTLIKLVILLLLTIIISHLTYLAILHTWPLITKYWENHQARKAQREREEQFSRLIEANRQRRAQKQAEDAEQQKKSQQQTQEQTQRNLEANRARKTAQQHRQKQQRLHAYETQRTAEQLKKRQEFLHQQNLNNAFKSWRLECKSLLQTPEKVTHLPPLPRTSCTIGHQTPNPHLKICSHNLEKLFRDAKLGHEELKAERNFWHTNRSHWARVPEMYRKEVTDVAEEVAKVLVDLVERSRPEEGRCNSG